MKTFFRCVLAVFFCVVIVNSAYADVYYEIVVKSECAPNSPKCAYIPPSGVKKTYISDNAQRVEDVWVADTFSIEYFDTMTAYSCSVKDKVCHKNDLKSKMDVNTEVTEPKTESTYTPTNEIRTIAGYDCKIYRGSWKDNKITTESEFCISKDVPGYKEINKSQRNQAKIHGRNPFMRKYFEQGESDGFLIHSVDNVISDNLSYITTSTLRMIEEKPLDKNLFKIPADYKVVNLLIDPHDPNAVKKMQESNQPIKRRTGPCFIGAVFSEEESE
jgi:hypothetical protein